MNNNFYSSNRAYLRNKFFSEFQSNDGITEYMTKTIQDLINNEKINNVLDIGTGNGFLAKKIMDLKIPKNIKVTAVDISEDMIRDAYDKNYPDLNLKVMDNMNLEFKDSSFDLVTAKAVTKISISEVFRVLKNNGYLVYKEYSGGKGMMNVFKQAWLDTPIGGLAIVNDLYKTGFRYIKIEYFKIPVMKSKDEIVSTIQTMHLAEDRHNKRLLKSLDNYPDNEPIKVVSDPYLIIARK